MKLGDRSETIILVDYHMTNELILHNLVLKNIGINIYVKVMEEQTCD